MLGLKAGKIASLYEQSAEAGSLRYEWSGQNDSSLEAKQCVKPAWMGDSDRDVSLAEKTSNHCHSQIRLAIASITRETTEGRGEIHGKV